jgi:3-hydroxybutyryl-CoA dehydrogenase
VNRIGIIGGGRMGCGIAQVFAAAGCYVTLIEKDESTLQDAQLRLAKALGRAPSRSAPDAVTDIDFRVGTTQLPAQLDLLVESVPESLDLKRHVLAETSTLVSADVLIVTNTSALSIDELADAVENPARFLGLHFFNPVPASSLVEIVVGARTSDTACESAVNVVKYLGKEAIVSRDSPGFVTSRLGILLGMEAIRMLEAGVADAEAIDKGMELGYRHAMGPLRATDLVGLDVRLAVAEGLSRKLGDRFAPPQLLKDKVARGELGRKSGQGFYRW